MSRLTIAGLILAVALVGCGGSQKSDDPDAINNALVGFSTCAQSSRWSEALQYITKSEAKQISENGVFKPEYQAAARRLPLSTMRRYEWKVDGSGRLIGMKDLMDKTNGRYVVSEDQAKVGTNLEEMEKQRIQRRLEEGRRVLEEQENQPEQEVEVYTNRLTDEERQKYGSTADMTAGTDSWDSGSDNSSYDDGNAGYYDDSNSGYYGDDQGYYGDDDQGYYGE